MIRMSRHRSAPADDEERVERFVGSMVLLGLVLIAAGVLYAGWYAVGPP